MATIAKNLESMVTFIEYKAIMYRLRTNLDK